MSVETQSCLQDSEQELKPLRYNPGLKCDPELEALRPERQSKHSALPSGDWKKYLIKTPPSYDGSFADADIQKFRPNPTPSLLEDSWYTSRLPVSGAVSSDQMIAEIKMRNRRYQQSVVGTEQTRPMMMMQPQQMMTEEMMMMTNLAYTDLQRQVHMLQAPPTAPLQAPRYQNISSSIIIQCRPDMLHETKDHIYRMVKEKVQQYLTKPNHCI